MNELEAWHFVREDGCLNYRPHLRVEVGATLRLGDGEEPVLCARGFHASMRALDALGYAPRTKALYVCRVRVAGTIVRDTDKLVASERTVLWMASARDTMVRWELWAATGALLGRALAGRTVDPRSWAAIETATAYLDGKATLQQARKTRADAYAAAYAAYAAAAAYAAYAAAYAASPSNRDAGAARSLLNDELENRLWRLAPPDARPAREVRP